MSLSQSRPWQAQPGCWGVVLLIEGCLCCLMDGQKCIFKLRKYCPAVFL